MSRNPANGIRRVAASAAPRRAVRIESTTFTLGRHMLVAPHVPLAGPVELLPIVGAALCEIAEMRKELDSMDASAAASLACALEGVHRDALRLLSSIAREVSNH